MGISQYDQDFDEMLPPSRLNSSKLPSHKLVCPYLKSYQIFKCPSHPGDTDGEADDKRTPASDEGGVLLLGGELKRGSELN